MRHYCFLFSSSSLNGCKLVFRKADLHLSHHRQCTFSLSTLYIPCLLLEDWILSHNKLEVLEIHDTWGPGVRLQNHQLSICKQLAMQNSSPLTVFLLGNFGLLHDRIIAFPVFSVHAPWNAKHIVDSLLWSNVSEVEYFKVVLNSLSEEGTVHDVLTSLAKHFVCLNAISFYVKDPQIHLVRRLKVLFDPFGLTFL